MNRRDLQTYDEIEKILNKREKEDSFSFFTDDVTEDLKYK